MKPRLVIVYLLIVLAPLALLVGLGLKVVRDEQAMVQIHFQEAHTARLRDLDRTIHGLLEVRERDWLRRLEGTTLDTAALRELVRATPTIQQVFLLGTDGKLLHPPPDSPLSNSERDFLVRAEQMWKDKQRFFQPADTEASSSGRRGEISSQGWYAWFWGSDLNLVFWRRLADGKIVGVECDRVRLLADIVAALPDVPTTYSNQVSGYTELLDAHGHAVYEWGATAASNSLAVAAAMPLSEPLGSWRLAVHAPGPQLGKGLFFNSIVGLALLAVVLSGLAVYFYRESTREIREATQRVSFVNQVSHELKTPLTNIRLYAELLEERFAGGETDPDAARHLQVIISESQRLSRLIGNVLTYARQQRDTLTMRPTPGCVDATIRAVLQNFSPSLEAKGIKTEFRAGAPATVRFDADALEQILGNLFSNVEKYAAGGGRLDVSSRLETGRTIVTVSDNGPGIPRGQDEAVFQPFHRLSHRLTERASGTGIGLTIARELARRHGGTVALVSTARGACFEVTLLTPPADATETRQPTASS